MKKVASLLSRPIDSAAPKLLARLRRAADKAAGRLTDPDDAEGLHDFRVKLRQLRTWLRICRPHLGKRMPKKVGRRLAELMEATNAGRDDQVHRQWVQKLLGHHRLLRREREGLRMLQDYLKVPASKPDIPFEEGLRQFQPVSDAVGSLCKERANASKKKKTGRPTLAATIGTDLQALAHRLQGQLKSVTSLEDQETLHQTRLTTKRLRYTLEPLSKQVPGAATAVKQLAGLQNLLGDLHDLQTMEARIEASAEQWAGEWAQQMIRLGLQDLQAQTAPQPDPPVDACRDLVAAAQLLRKQERQRFDALRKRWLGAAADEIFPGITRVAARLMGDKAILPSVGMPAVKRPVVVSASADASVVTGATGSHVDTPKPGISPEVPNSVPAPLELGELPAILAIPNASQNV